MAKFIERVQERQLQEALVSLKGFDFYEAMYVSAGSYGAALDLFFDTLIRDAEQLVHAYSSVAADEDLIERCIEAANEMNSFGTQAVVRAGQIAKIYKVSNQNAKLFNEKMTELETSLEAPLNDMRKLAQRLLADLKAVSLKEGVDTAEIPTEDFDKVKHVLVVFSTLTARKFFDILLSGKVSWLR